MVQGTRFDSKRGRETGMRNATLDELGTLGQFFTDFFNSFKSLN